MAKSTRGAAPAKGPEGERELIVIMKTGTAMRASANRFEAAPSANIRPLEQLLQKHGATMKPLFGPTEERVATTMSRQLEGTGVPAADLTVFYAVQAPDAQLDALAAGFVKSDAVEAAYVKPPTYLPVRPDTEAAQPAPADMLPATPDLTARQIYLNAAPDGIDAHWAWTQAGGRGQGIRIIDIEGAWRFTHEDLMQNQGGVVGGTQFTTVDWRNHGTAVLGEYSGDHNAIGIRGISPDAIAMAISHGGIGSAAAINDAAGRLAAGDIILLEMHRPGPRFNYAGRQDQRGYIAVEWWPDDFAAIRNAANRGIIVVEAAGNGAEDLDDNIYQTPGPGFPANWTNPFRRNNRDSGAIVVGAGAPPPGTHGRNHGPDRSRLDFSNWGALIDCQGWGREVTTCGYGDVQGGTNEDLWYTDTFSGTSSASPIVTGAVASLQGIARARSHAPLTPAEVRNCLRNSGSPQQASNIAPVAQRIGTRPDMRGLVACALPRKPLKEFQKAEIKERKEVVKEQLKDALKDFQKAEFKERKELKEKDFKDAKEFAKEFKERDKNLKEKDKEKDLVEGGGGFRDRIQPTNAPALEDRLAMLEQAVSELTHFIGAELRPDLARSALRNDELQGQAEQAKHEKDLKDIEKLSEV